MTSLYAIYGIGACCAGLLLGYLIYALIRAEEF